jgi:hypothetical protein
LAPSTHEQSGWQSGERPSSVALDWTFDDGGGHRRYLSCSLGQRGLTTKEVLDMPNAAGDGIRKTRSVVA